MWPEASVEGPLKTQSEWGSTNESCVLFLRGVVDYCPKLSIIFLMALSLVTFSEEGDCATQLNHSIQLLECLQIVIRTTFL